MASLADSNNTTFTITDTDNTDEQATSTPPDPKIVKKSEIALATALEYLEKVKGDLEGKNNSSAADAIDGVIA